MLLNYLNGAHCLCARVSPQIRFVGNRIFSVNLINEIHCFVSPTILTVIQTPDENSFHRSPTLYLLDGRTKKIEKTKRTRKQRNEACASNVEWHNW